MHKCRRLHNTKHWSKGKHTDQNLCFVFFLIVQRHLILLILYFLDLFFKVGEVHQNTFQSIPIIHQFKYHFTRPRQISFSNLFPFLTLALFTGSDPPKVDRIPQSASGTDQPEFIIFLGIFQIFRNRFGCDSFPMTIRNGDLNRILMPDPIQYQTSVLDVSCILIRITIQILIKDRYIFRKK